MKRYKFNNLHMNRPSIIFTWDDNSLSHSVVVAPIFSKLNVRCTFYINPGEDEYTRDLAMQYARLSLQHFEVGSHSFTHLHLSSLSNNDFIQQLYSSFVLIERSTGTRPSTFAFPHHDFNDDMLNKAREYYLETRNTLSNSCRFSLKSKTSQSEVSQVIYSNVERGISTVFSGHAVINSEKTQNAGISGIGNFYEPITNTALSSFLESALKIGDQADVCTFEQASLKEYFKKYCTYDDSSVTINEECMQKLECFGINHKRLVLTL